MGAREQIIELRKQHGDWTEERIGNSIGKTKQWVSKILREANLPTRAIRTSLIRICPVCSRPTPNNQKSCPGECKRDFYFIIIKCDFCNRPHTIRKFLYKKAIQEGTQFMYCSNECKGLGSKLKSARKNK
ncbi:MAG: hypothetical protein ABIC57_04295 [bacterium]